MSKLSKQMEEKVAKDAVPKRTKSLKGSFDKTISTGSTLLDLAISGGRSREGGLPGGMLVEIFGPNGSGKTVLLCEIAGDVKRKGGDVMFSDPEARLNKQFARQFDLNVDDIEYNRPQTVPEVFAPVRAWEPKGNKVIHGVFADSLAALTTDMELDGGDKYGMKRAKEFSQELRTTCRVLAEKNILMVCSNQVRENLDAGQYGQKYKSPGGLAVGFYSSVRLRMVGSEKIRVKSKFHGKDISKVVGIETKIEVFKSSVDAPYREAPLNILFDYGIDDIRANLQYLKDFSGHSVYTAGGLKLDKAMDKSIAMVEDGELEKQLKNDVIELWNEIEVKMKKPRKSKNR